MKGKRLLLWGIKILSAMLLIHGCGTNSRNPGSFRGDTILYIRITHEDGRVENIAANKDRIVSRSFSPVTARSHINREIIPEDLWDDLQTLQQDWCEQSPLFSSEKALEVNTEISFQCGRFRNPVYVIDFSQLPPPLQALIELVPSPRQS